MKEKCIIVISLFPSTYLLLTYSLSHSRVYCIQRSVVYIGTHTHTHTHTHSVFTYSADAVPRLVHVAGCGEAKGKWRAKKKLFSALGYERRRHCSDWFFPFSAFRLQSAPPLFAREILFFSFPIKLEHFGIYGSPKYSLFKLRLTSSLHHQSLH